jgi:nucleoside phosphorylase
MRPGKAGLVLQPIGRSFRHIKSVLIFAYFSPLRRRAYPPLSTEHEYQTCSVEDFAFEQIRVQGTRNPVADASKRRHSLDMDREATHNAKKSKAGSNEAPISAASNTVKKMTNNDYTVGWICAITVEYVAAQVFLDERHDGPESIAPNNTSTYTLGRVGEHNVVIGTLPDGEYGIAAATGVARDMMHNFPNVRIGLMVGVGGGVPSPKHDIRLGDIVVSAPRDGRGGVFQYDFGKTVQGESFQNTKFLDQPPMVLRGAVAGLRAQYEIDDHCIDNAINSVLNEKPRMRKKYRRPDPESDRLYRSKFIHPRDDGAKCAIDCGNDPSVLVLRPSRTEEDDNPAIHYGLIASANQLMEDALIRDRLAEENDILCFEMEAAGLMNQFPCLVIRGICDYSDSHKSEEWQGYAAMVAAAYAKGLLCRIPPTQIEAEKKISELLRDG